MIKVTRGQSIDWQIRFKTVDITGGVWSERLSEMTGYSIAITDAVTGKSMLRVAAADTVLWTKGHKRLRLALTLPSGKTYPVNLDIQVV